MKAIAILTNIRNLETDFDHTKISSVDEALEELEALNTKIEELKEWVKEEYKNSAKQWDEENSSWYSGEKAAYWSIIEKLEELDK